MKVFKGLQITLAVALLLSLQACGSSSGGSSDSSQNYKGVDSIEQVPSYNSGQMGITQNSVADGSYYEEDYQKDQNQAKESGDQAETSDQAEDSDQKLVDGTTDANGNKIKLVEEKLVYRCQLDIETKNYAEDKENLMKLISEYEGIIQNSNEYDSDDYWYSSDHVKTRGTKTLNLQVRIPSEKYKEFIGTVGTIGKVKRNSQQVDNISYDYYNTQADIEQLKIQEQRLLEMMEQAYTIEDMITVEDRLSEVQNELSKLQTKLVGLDTDVAYSYVDIELEEVFEYSAAEVEKPGFFKRLGKEIVDGFKAMIQIFEDIILFVVGAVPRLIPFAVFGFIVYKIVKVYRRNHKPRKPKDKKPRGNNQNGMNNYPMGNMNNFTGQNGYGGYVYNPNDFTGPDGYNVYQGPVNREVNNKDVNVNTESVSNVVETTENMSNADANKSSDSSDVEQNKENEGKQ